MTPNWYDIIPGGGIVLVAGYFLASGMSPLLAIFCVGMGLFFKSVEQGLAASAVTGIAYQALNIGMQWENLPDGILKEFAAYGCIGSAIAGMAWFGAAYGAKRLFRKT